MIDNQKVDEVIDKLSYGSCSYCQYLGLVGEGAKPITPNRSQISGMCTEHLILAKKRVEGNINWAITSKVMTKFYRNRLGQIEEELTYRGK